MNYGGGAGGRSLRADPDRRFIYIPMTMKMRRILRKLFVPVTIKDVVALAGVSPSTVSRTYRDHPSISHQIKKKVRQATVKLGYEPNFQASSLATQNSRAVGIILPLSGWKAYQNPFYLEMIRGISQYYNQKQYVNTVIMGQSENEILQAIKTTARTGPVEGFVVLYPREQDPVLDYFYEEELLYILVGRAYRNVNRIIYVDSDNVLTGREAVRYLLNLDHVRIACLSGDHSLLCNHDRKMGHVLALAERGIPLDDQLCVEVSSMSEEQNQALAALFAKENKPTAILISDDILAVTLEKARIGLGLSIPGDVSILSFNNFLLVRLTFPSPTSVDVNACQLGIEVATQMISHVESPEPAATRTIVPYHIVGQGSCAGARGSRGD